MSPDGSSSDPIRRHRRVTFTSASDSMSSARYLSPVRAPANLDSPPISARTNSSNVTAPSFRTESTPSCLPGERREAALMLQEQHRVLGCTKLQGHTNAPDQLHLAELGTLASNAMAPGDTPAAISHCERMIAMAAEAFGPRDIRLVPYLRQAASTLAAASRDGQDIEALTRAIVNDLYGVETTEAASHLRNLAELQQRRPDPRSPAE